MYIFGVQNRDDLEVKRYTSWHVRKSLVTGIVMAAGSANDQLRRQNHLPNDYLAEHMAPNQDHNRH
jgi:hypothetical protein